MLEHKENFELEYEYEKIWDTIRYKKVDEIYEYTEEIIALLENHIEDKLLFHRDYEKIQYLFKKMKQKNFFYTSKSAQEIIKAANPKFENIYTDKECIRELEYLGNGLPNDKIQKGKIYKSTHFNGATYTLDVDGKKKIVGSSYFKRIS